MKIEQLISPGPNRTLGKMFLTSKQASNFLLENQTHAFLAIQWMCLSQAFGFALTSVTHCFRGDPCQLSNKNKANNREFKLLPFFIALCSESA